jgi:aminopeptidase N
MKTFLITSLIRFLFAVLLGAAALDWTPAQTSSPSSFTVTHYDVVLEPDITNKLIKGSMNIQLESQAVPDGTSTIELDCGELTVDSVSEGKQQLEYSQVEHRLRLTLLRAKRGLLRNIAIEYHGAPRRGIRFFPDSMQVYTVFSTSQWMICIDDPDKRATLRLRLVVPADLTTVGNGRFVARRNLSTGKAEHEWRQDRPVPSYTFGFVVGRFRTVTEKHRSLELNYLGGQFTDDQLRRIFRDTGDMVEFYEQRAGVKYPGASYTQVLAMGAVAQEMAGFTALGEKYGPGVLANERDIWLGAHELAHQWWGIGVGCKAWTHFWLNEGMATFMADAYKEHRFGRSEYLKEIDESRKLYEKVRDAGKDRSLVFPDWLHPTAEDRTLVYDKGAYVLHLLREEMGEQAFWTGLRAYTRKYFGKSVTTEQFQAAMQQAGRKDLTPFFNKWVYRTAI